MPGKPGLFCTGGYQERLGKAQHKGRAVLRIGLCAYCPTQIFWPGLAIPRGTGMNDIVCETCFDRFAPAQLVLEAV